MKTRNSLTRFEKSVLEKPTLAFHAFNDVFTPGQDGNPVDFDAELTTMYRGLRPHDSHYGIEGHQIAPLGAYAVELIYELVNTARQEVNKSVERSHRSLCRAHPDVRQAATDFRRKTVRVLINSAPRTKEDSNGENFHLAISDNGVEFYVSSLSVLAHLRDKITGLFEIPNTVNPLFDGEREQFRSSIVSRFHEVLLAGHVHRKPQDQIKSPFPLTYVAYVDRFGNIRLRGFAADYENIFHPDNEGRNTVFLGLGEKDQPIAVSKATCLREVPPGELGVYRNVADGERSPYWELVRRWGGENDRKGAYECLEGIKLGDAVKVIGPF
ncbi:hypothetical protein COY07_01120 [Candidatus Peregrinibacteria bacterium CG_4_10_14_0_2_um_filter_43_11]|nr:MAG: hypothetical protein COY07_01120 [Candidatus Peregrinibacteria bacterium CG_4_10_14_0_2_um_filter_43_11]